MFTGRRCGGTAARSAPSSAMRPASGCTNPPIARSSVGLARTGAAQQHEQFARARRSGRARPAPPSRRTRTRQSGRRLEQCGQCPALKRAHMRRARPLRRLRHRADGEERSSSAQASGRCWVVQRCPGGSSAARRHRVRVAHRIGDAGHHVRLQHEVDERERRVLDAARPPGSPACRSRAARLPSARHSAP